MFSRENSETKMSKSQDHMPSKHFERSHTNTGQRNLDIRYCLLENKLWYPKQIFTLDYYMLKTTNKEYCFEF